MRPRGPGGSGRGPGWQRDHRHFLPPLRRAVGAADAQVSRLVNCPVRLSPNHVRRWSSGTAPSSANLAGVLLMATGEPVTEENPSWMYGLFAFAALVADLTLVSVSWR